MIAWVDRQYARIQQWMADRNKPASPYVQIQGAGKRPTKIHIFDQTYASVPVEHAVSICGETFYLPSIARYAVFGVRCARCAKALERAGATWPDRVYGDPA